METNVETKRTVQTCRWAEPTLFQPLPIWLDAWNMPWACRREASARLIASSDQCALCPRWEQRCPNGVSWNFAAFAQ